MFDSGMLFLLFIFAILFSMLFNYGGPKLMNYALARPTIAKYGASYYGKTLLTAATVFIFLVVVSVAMSAVGEKPSLPSA